MLTQVRLKEVLHYDPLTGLFTRLVRRGGYKVGSKVGSFDKDGYIKIIFDGVCYQAHRLAWFYMTGNWPDPEVDHEDLDKANNIWANLREATHGQNSCNREKLAVNSSGFKGVCWNKKVQKWQAQISYMGQQKYLGVFDIPQDAHLAYCAAAAQHHQQFARLV